MSEKERRLLGVLLLPEEPKIACREAGDIREDYRQLCRADSKPLRKCAAVLRNGGGWDQSAPRICVLSGVKGERRQFTVNPSSMDSSTHDEVMASPGMI